MSDHPCPKQDDCALNRGAVLCKHCNRAWPPDESWDIDDKVRTESAIDRNLNELRRLGRAHPELGDEAVLATWVHALVERVVLLEERVLDLERIEHGRD